MAAKYRVGVIGHTGRGDYGHGLDVAWRDVANCEIVAVADPHDAGRAQAARRTGASKQFADYREMLDEARPDVVSICPRWLDQHAEMVQAAAERGIHIYLEKPLCRTLAEADAMVAACSRNHVKLAIAFQTRYSPKLPVLRNLIEDGALGEILELRARGKEDGRGGGEDLWVLGTHVLNLMQYFAGEPNWCFAQVLQDNSPITKEHVAEGAEGIGPLAGDTVAAMYGMDEGVVGHFDSHRGAAGNPSRFGLRIFGSKGIVHLTTGYVPEVHFLPDSSWLPGRSGKAWIPVSTQGVGEPEPLAGQTSHHGNMVACQDLLRSIEEDRQPEASIFEARTTVEMIASVFESHRVGRPVTLPLATRDNPLKLLS